MAKRKKYASLEEKFHDGYVPEPNTGCWLWFKATDGHGYGQLRNPGSGPGRNVLAHRVSFEISNGSIPAGMVIMHSCDQPLCVNPDHLRLGTMKDNSQDMIAKGRRRIVIYSKLSNQDVQAIRLWDQSGEVTKSEIAAAFNLNRGSVSRLCSLQRRAEVPNPGVTQ